ncbi:MAG: glycosyltransferase family 2 protein [Patescibacteria group bacterium]|nr:glycosyltransferase family 2 protein [Patescibacteria group bacterium]
MSLDISVIIVSWKVKERLRANLSALMPALNGLSAEVFVVDNNSQDGSAEMVAKEFPTARLIVNRENLGFAKANNQAIKEAKGNFILLLNPDMLVFPGTIKDMLAWMKANPQAVVAACRLETESGDLLPHVRRFPRLSDQLVIVLKFPHLFPSLLDAYLCKNFDYGQASKVDSIRGAFFMINSAAWQNISASALPLLDERYFIWFEEVDFCRQVYKNGGEVWYTPAARCLDYVGQSFSQIKVRYKQHYVQDSMLKYFQKWHPHWQYYILKSAWPIGHFLVRLFT